MRHKLLFGRDGKTARPFNKFASQSGVDGENRISLRDGRCPAKITIAILVCTLGDDLEFPVSEFSPVALASSS